jgi:hypothetical protein
LATLFNKTTGLVLMLLVASSSWVLAEEKKAPASTKSSAKAPEKAPTEVPAGKSSSSDAKGSEKAEAPPTASQAGWFIGFRGAYVPSLVLELGYHFNNTFKLRMIAAGLVRSYRAYYLDGQTYDRIRFKPQKLGLMADWNPWKNGFRFSGGIAYNGDRMQMTHTVTGTLLGQPASVYGTITANYKYRWAIVPYLGIGYDTGSLGCTGISLSADAGFWFQGKVRPRVSLTGTGRNIETVVNTVKEHTAYLINSHKMWRNVPMVSLGIRYKF